MEIIKVPGINGGNPKSRDSGNAVIEKLDSIINSKGLSINKQELNIEEIHVNNKNLQEQESLIHSNSLEAFEEQDKIIFLGGDHSISYSTIRAFFDCFSKEEEPFLLVFDKFLDLEDYSSLPGNKSWLKAIINKHGSDNLLVVGAAEILGNRHFFQENNIKVVSISQFTSDLKDTTDFIMEITRQKPLYVSLDISCIGEEGFSNQQILYIMKRIAMMKNLKALDIVESDSEEKIKIASRILAEFL